MIDKWSKGREGGREAGGGRGRWRERGGNRMNK